MQYDIELVGITDGVQDEIQVCFILFAYADSREIQIEITLHAKYVEILLFSIH